MTNTQTEKLIPAIAERATETSSAERTK